MLVVTATLGPWCASPRRVSRTANVPTTTSALTNTNVLYLPPTASHAQAPKPVCVRVATATVTTYVLHLLLPMGSLVLPVVLARAAIVTLYKVSALPPAWVMAILALAPRNVYRITARRLELVVRRLKVVYASTLQSQVRDRPTMLSASGLATNQIDPFTL